MSNKRRPITWIEFKGPRYLEIGPCHDCTSHTLGTDGYPSLWKNGQNHHMARILLEESIGPLGAGLVTRHKCDNTHCIRLDHLEPGTVQENCTDRDKRGRHNPPVGERAGNTHLTSKDIETIRSSGESQYVLAERYGICQPEISKIRNWKRWAHV